MDDIILTTFTDPMMGLSYECEPVYASLKERYAGRIAFRYVMAGLVRDVSDFMTPEELAMPEKEGLAAYNRRLALIYKSEEPMGGLPMNMDGFHLFDTEHRSSYPLDIAFKAAQLCEPDKAEPFLLRLRRATLLEGRQTTLKTELVAVAQESGIDAARFRQHLEDGSAEEAFLDDRRLTRSLGIRRLPSCLIQLGGDTVLVNGMIGIKGFESAIGSLLSKQGGRA
ncbi:MAG: DsbA family protein [Mailhella sp.]|nr:DsbA family protein [Mailhella sp.]